MRQLGAASFFGKQMDLNWDNPAVREDVIAMVNRWLDKGVDGFRMDVINYSPRKKDFPREMKQSEMLDVSFL